MMTNRSVPVDTLLPHITYENLSSAAAWLTKVLGFTEHYRYGEPVSGIQMRFGRSYVMVANGEGRATPAQLGSGTQSLTVFVEDVDAHFAAAKAAGAKIVEDLHETVYGERQYGVKDLEGHHWLFSCHARDVSPDEWGATIAKTMDRVGLYEALFTPGRSPEIPETEDVYGWLVGSWELDIEYYATLNVAERGIKGEVHFGWALEGRAIQDVWIMPRRSDRVDLGKANNFYGTTLRVWDPSIEAWRITWINPVNGHHEEQIGRRSGKEIVQIGTRSNGVPTRWSFTEITPDSFLWSGEALEPDGRTWKLEGQFRAKRTR